MKTAPVTRPGASSRAARNDPTISAADRLRASPSFPVAQNRQPMAQPTWDDRHTVNAPGLWIGIRTASNTAPSSARNRYRTVPRSMGSSTRSTIAGRVHESVSSSARVEARTGRGRSSVPPRLTTCASTWRAIASDRSTPRTASHPASSAGSMPSRLSTRPAYHARRRMPCEIRRHGRQTARREGRRSRGAVLRGGVRERPRGVRLRAVLRRRRAGPRVAPERRGHVPRQLEAKPLGHRGRREDTVKRPALVVVIVLGALFTLTCGGVAACLGFLTHWQKEAILTDAVSIGNASDAIADLAVPGDLAPVTGMRMEIPFTDRPLVYYAMYEGTDPLRYL